jgi:hypothetical protein
VGDEAVGGAEAPGLGEEVAEFREVDGGEADEDHGVAVVVGGGEELGGFGGDEGLFLAFVGAVNG